MILSVTGTRHGMTDAQQQAFASLIRDLDFEEFHHGSCRGADVEAARAVDLLRQQQEKGILIVAHPGPPGDSWRGYAGVDDRAEIGKNHFARNRDLVAVCDLLVVIPFDSVWQPFGGTWMTHDTARKKGKKTVIIWPDGKVEGMEVAA